MKAPATANEYTSTPKMLRMDSPPNKKRSISTKETKVINSGWIFPVFFCVSRIIGMLPTMSITANNTMKQEPISTQFMRRNYTAIVGNKLHFRNKVFNSFWKVCNLQRSHFCFDFSCITIFYIALGLKENSTFIELFIY